MHQLLYIRSDCYLQNRLLMFYIANKRLHQCPTIKWCFWHLAMKKHIKNSPLFQMLVLNFSSSTQLYSLQFSWTRSVQRRIKAGQILGNAVSYILFVKFNIYLTRKPLELFLNLSIVILFYYHSYHKMKMNNLYLKPHPQISH